MAYIIGAIIGYLFGCVNMANIIAKSRGIDIKAVGSNNAGASNVFVSIGKIYGVAVGAFDILKAFLAAELTLFLFSSVPEAAFVAGVMAVMGHDFPFWMHFRGGKGLASFMGVVLFYDWKVFLCLAVIIAAAALITDFISIGSLSVSAIMPVYTVIIKEDIFTIVVFAVLGVMVWIKHIENIKRIANRTEIGFLRKNRVKK